MSICTDLLNINDAENWILRVVSSRQAQVLNENSHIPIKGYDLNIELTVPYLLAEVTANYKKTTWKYGGSLYPIHPINGFFATEKGVGLRVSNTLIINVNTLSNEYRLFYQPPSWFRDVTIKIWEYQGTIANRLSTQLDRIETKVMSLQSGGGNGGGGVIGQNVAAAHFTGLI